MPPETDDPARAAYVAALRRLGRRDHTVEELRRHLARRGHDEAVIETVLARLTSERALDDGRFAQQFARSRLAHRGLGQNRIRHELKRKGVARTAVDRGVKEALGEVPEAEVLDAIARRFWRERTRDEPRLRLRKLWAFLLRRGFPAPLVNDRLRALWPKWNDALAGLEPDEGAED